MITSEIYAISVSKSFDVVVTADCVVAKFEPPTSISFIYDLDNPVAKVFTIDAWNQGSCKYTETLTLVPDSTNLIRDWLTDSLSTRTLTIDSSSVSL